MRKKIGVVKNRGLLKKRWNDMLALEKTLLDAKKADYEKSGIWREVVGVRGEKIRLRVPEKKKNGCL